MISSPRAGLLRSPLRKIVLAAALVATPAAGAATWALEAGGAPTPHALNFVCASLDQVNLGLCLGPPIPAGLHRVVR